MAAGDFQLVAGTAWLFSRPEFDQAFDYLFVDEAGQVAVANLVAMGTSARNIVLLGDQMQLGQPVQGVHPGRSGDSSLEYLLDGMATISPDRGVFLDRRGGCIRTCAGSSRRPCTTGGCMPEAEQREPAARAGTDAHPALRPTGVRFVPVEHDGCTQRSDEEAARVAALYRSLARSALRRSGRRGARDGGGERARRRAVQRAGEPPEAGTPRGARVGTVDKFQGQEAEAVIVSMTTSSGDGPPAQHGVPVQQEPAQRRDLAGAVPRARGCEPEAAEVRCSTPEQMALVNTLCWVKTVSEAGDR